MGKVVEIDNTSPDDNWITNKTSSVVTVACTEMFGSFNVTLGSGETKRVTFDVEANVHPGGPEYELGKGERWEVRHDAGKLTLRKAGNVSKSGNAGRIVSCKHCKCKFPIEGNAWICPNCGKRPWADIVFFFALSLAISLAGVYRLSDDGSNFWWLPTVAGWILLAFCVRTLVLGGLRYKRKKASSGSG
jgi:hypothetical protein